jgi:outer membrane receptor protein involved in Fe transport
MDNFKQINFLKIKGSTGVLGNQSTYSPYAGAFSPDYLAYPGLQQGITAPFGNNLATGALNAYTPNPDLKWETVNAYEFGLELNAFDNRLHFEADYYNKLTKNMMTFVDLSSLGLLPKLENGGELKNWGEEFSGTWTQ